MKDLMAGFEKELKSHVKALDATLKRLKYPSNPEQLVKTKRLLLNNRANLHIEDIFISDTWPGGELLDAYITEKFDIVRKRYEDVLSLLDLQIEHNRKIQQPERTFPDYLNHPDAEKFAAKIKEKFPSIFESGKISAALYRALQRLDKIKNGSNTEIHRVMSEYFGGIGNLSGFNSYLNPKHQKYMNLKEEGLIDKFMKTLNNL